MSQKDESVVSDRFKDAELFSRGEFILFVETPAYFHLFLPAQLDQPGDLPLSIVSPL